MPIEKAAIINEDSKKRIPVLFNPTEYSLSKSNNWTQVSIKKLNVPVTEFVGGSPTELKVQLFFDTYEKQRDVREYTEEIIELTRISDYPDGLRPPKCRFTWGRAKRAISFISVITSLSYKYTLFLDNGTPVRATMDLTFRECEDVDAKQGQESPPMGIAGHKVLIVKPGDTIDRIATQEYGDPKLWRFIADANGLDNPKDLDPGQVLRIQPIEELPV